MCILIGTNLEICVRIIQRYHSMSNFQYVSAWTVQVYITPTSCTWRHSFYFLWLKYDLLEVNHRAQISPVSLFLVLTLDPRKLNYCTMTNNLSLYITITANTYQIKSYNLHSCCYCHLCSCSCSWGWVWGVGWGWHLWCQLIHGLAFLTTKIEQKLYCHGRNWETKYINIIKWFLLCLYQSHGFVFPALCWR